MTATYSTFIILRPLAAGLVCAFGLSATELVAGSVTDPANFQVTTNGTVVTVRRTNAVEYVEFHQSFPDGDIVSKLILKSGAGGTPICFYPDEASALPDGIYFESGQWRIKSAGALGTGPVTIGAAQFVAVSGSGALDVTNKVVFEDAESRVIATSATDYFVLHSLGVTNSTVFPWLGRASGTSRMTLALTEDSNEYLRQIRLSGALYPLAFDGGTVRIARTAESPYFNYVGSDSDKAVSRYVFASTNAVTFDAQYGADVRLGLPLKLAGVSREVFAEPPIANWSFENGETGWTFSRDSTSGGKVGVIDNGNTTWALNGCSTPYGTYYYTLRCLHQIASTGTIALTAASDWYVSLFAATRSGGHGSEKVQITVKLTESTSGESYEATTPQQSAAYEFKEFKLGPFDLPAGNYKVTISTSWPGEKADPNKWSAVSVDNIQLCRTVETPASLVKTGGGRLTLDGLSATGTVFTVNGGALALLSSAVTNATATVGEDGTFELGPELAPGADGLTVTVAAGGTLTLCDRKDGLVRNGWFEQDEVETYIQMSPREWSLTTDKSWPGSGNGSGLQKCGCNMSPKGPYSEYGDVTPYLRNRTLLTQTVTVPEAGAYRLSFVRARRDRSDYDWSTFHLRAFLVQGSVTNLFDDIALTNAFERFAGTADLAAGSCKICFETYGENQDNGSMAFIDDVTLSRVSPLGTLKDVRVNLATGAKIRLENAQPARIEYVYVDGVRVSGHEASLRAAGATVTGTGRLAVGEPRGVKLLFK